MDHIVLLGAEDVRSAGGRMASAASDMIRAASIIEETWQRQRQYMEEWIKRLEEIIKDGHRILDK